MDFLKKNKFEETLNLKREDVFEEGKLSYSIYTNEEFEILYVVEIDLNFNQDSYFNSSIYGKVREIYHPGNCFYILSSLNHYYIIPFNFDCPSSQKFNDFEIIVNHFEEAKNLTLLKKANNEFQRIEGEIRPLLSKANEYAEYFYNSWLQHGDLKKFNYNKSIKIQLPYYIQSDLIFNLNILEPEEISHPDIESEGYIYLNKSTNFSSYIALKKEIIEILKTFCNQHNLEFNITKFEHLIG